MIRQLRPIRPPRTPEQRQRSSVASVHAWRRRHAQRAAVPIRDGSIEAGLLCLKVWQSEHPEVDLTLREIAYVCGCSAQYIDDLEQRALAKLRRRQWSTLARFWEEGK